MPTACKTHDRFRVSVLAGRLSVDTKPTESPSDCEVVLAWSSNFVNATWYGHWILSSWRRPRISLGYCASLLTRSIHADMMQDPLWQPSL
jgi:hypothetical protein